LIHVNPDILVTAGAFDKLRVKPGTIGVGGGKSF